MKGIVCEQPGQFRLKEFDSPLIKYGEALVRIRRVGICGSDLGAFKGDHPLVTYPRILGHELSGEIAEIGGYSPGFSVGDRAAVLPYIECGKCIACRQGKTNCCTRLEVYGVHRDGGMQEYMSVPSDHLIKSAKLNFDQMAMAECLGIGAHAVRRSQIKEGELALVIGAGPIGIGVMQFAKVASAKVIAVDLVQERLQFCRENKWVDYAIPAQGEWIKEIESITKGDYPPAVFDASGNVRSMENAFNLVGHGGILVMVGLVKGNISFADPNFHRRELTVMSSRNATREDLEYVSRSMEEGKVDALPLITHRAPLDQIIGRFDSWLKPETGVIKAIVEL
ncbi:MAG: zinc-binding alcohol dehydrogenase family protein [Deltaproteobacteria bacterium]|nr:zinc-binding alcohol dehydrogenase family protein [Deltaproteobacteria bacterium]